MRCISTAYRHCYCLALLILHQDTLAERVVVAKMVIGADGNQSTVRQAILQVRVGHSPKPHGTLIYAGLHSSFMWCGKRTL
jgi:2-polyprenyl-6-methoxyphenol hydroxylase-like FAD-dependent oxidoreductase